MKFFAIATLPMRKPRLIFFSERLRRIFFLLLDGLFGMAVSLLVWMQILYLTLFKVASLHLTPAPVSE